MLNEVIAMSDGIYTALSGAMVMDQNLEILSNNLANVSTPGFKAQRPVFESVLVRAENAIEDRSDVQVAQLGSDMTQGDLIETGNDLDMALNGEGFFVVNGPGGQPQYTRRGLMSLDTDRRLTVGGLPLRAEGGGDLVIPDQSYIYVEPDGGIYANDELVGQLEVVRFDAPEDLRPVGGGFFEGNGAQPADDFDILQGYAEGSNVNPIWGMTELIRTTRVFEATQKAIQAYKDIDRTLATEVGRY
ncbi:MAG: flagellar hook basal-body protein [Myxococcota bacterium]